MMTMFVVDDEVATVDADGDYDHRNSGDGHCAARRKQERAEVTTIGCISSLLMVTPLLQERVLCHHTIVYYLD